VKRILAIRFARLGDVILLQTALASIKRSLPDASITLMTGHRCAPIAELNPVVDEVIAVDRLAMRDGPLVQTLIDLQQLVAGVRRKKFDVVIDFHSFRETNLLTWLSRAPIRIGLKRFHAAFLGFCFNRPPVEEDKSMHVSEMFQRVAEALDQVVRISSSEPTLRIPDSLRSRVTGNLPQGRRMAFYVDAPVADRRWPADRFAAVADYVVSQFDAVPLILSSSENSHLTEAVLKSSRNPQRLHAFYGLTLPELAATIDACDLLISNDTGPMHLGPALGICTLGLFSVGLPEHFSPVGNQNRVLKAMPIVRISVESVKREVSQMWATVADRDPRH
jgi:heptosyltransferase-2